MNIYTLHRAGSLSLAYSKLLTSLGSKQIINTATRCNDTTSLGLDHIVTTRQENSVREESSKQV